MKEIPCHCEEAASWRPTKQSRFISRRLLCRSSAKGGLTPRNDSPNGFTFIDVMLTLAVFGIVLGFSFLYHESSQFRADLNSQAGIIVSYLRLAQSNASSGRVGQPRALHFDSDFYTLFSTPTYSATETSNYSPDFPPSLSIQNIALSGGGTDVVFSSPHGETATFGSFDITSSGIDSAVTITISSNGAIAY